jgi:hypothetical protein
MECVVRVGEEHIISSGLCLRVGGLWHCYIETLVSTSRELII